MPPAPPGVALTDLAYLAGYFDGEGCVSITGRSLSARITNTHLPSLVRLQATFGGSIHSPMPLQGHRQKHQWSTYGAHAEVFLRAIVPHLHEKKAQAFLALRWRELPDGDERGALREALGDLKRTTHFPMRKP